MSDLSTRVGTLMANWRHEPAVRVRLLTICSRWRGSELIDRAKTLDATGLKAHHSAGSERSAAWLAHLPGGQGVGSSNLPAPTIEIRYLVQIAETTKTPLATN